MVVGRRPPPDDHRSRENGRRRRAWLWRDLAPIMQVRVHGDGLLMVCPT